MPDFLEEFWKEYALNKPDLKCLRQDAALYRTMLMQVHDEISYDNSGIWITNKAEAEKKFDSAFKLAFKKSVELFVTPEYSCPWATLISQINCGCVPDVGALWIIGCHSITPKELSTIINENKSVVWIYDEDLINRNLNSKDFLDPVCIVLKTSSLKGEIVTVILVQFKTYFFGGHGFEWERDHLIVGSKFYVLSNKETSSRLLVLICSDSLNPTLNIESASSQFVNIPYLVIHIQLNQRPNALNYKTYRNTLFSRSYLDKEVICLNWARNVQAEGKQWNEYGGSALYMKSDKLNLSDERVNENHKHGLYYTRWIGRRTHLYLFNFDEHIFVFENTKPSQLLADPSQLSRSGALMIETLQYNGSTWERIEGADDGLAKCCQAIEDSEGSLSCLKGNTHYINGERLVQLTNGDIIFENDWHRVDKLKSVVIEDGEQNRRIFFTHEPTADIIDERNKKLLRYATLKHHILKSEIIPPMFNNLTLKLDSTLPTIDKYLLNVHSSIDFIRGTALYIGDALPFQATNLRAKLEGLFQDTHFGKNVMVFFTHFGTIKLDFGDHNVAPKAAENVTKSKVSIKRTGAL
jgi:hypothetical protein